jgi:tripartite-type tricarboxylate transporter receptor subunit TctC
MRAWVWFVAVASTVHGGGAVVAETYPAKPVRVIAAFPHGGFVDFTARLVAGPPGTAESGLPGYEMLNWLGLFAPAATPRQITERLSAESVRVVTAPEVRERLNAQGAEPAPLATGDFAMFVKSEIEKWAKMVAATGMAAD